MNDLHSHFRTVSDARWRDLLMQSVRQPEIDGARFPGFPPDSTQVRFTSLAQEGALDEALRFYGVVRAGCAKHKRPLGTATRLLDFGVGWGRICRTFMRDVPAQSIFGVDVNEQILATCRELVPWGQYSLCTNGAPLAFERGAFNLVVAFSVFSHLSEANHWHWLNELHRVLEPGGTLVFTTLSRSFLGMCRGAASAPDANDWNRDLAAHVNASYPNWKEDLERLDPSAYFYLRSGGGLQGLEPDNYGWAMIQPGYAKRRWKELFEITDYVDDSKVLPQAYFVLRRR